MSWVRNIYYDFLMLRSVESICRLAQRNCATVFMLHRFRDEGRGIHGFDPQQLRNGLAVLRERGYDLVSLSALFGRMREGGPALRGAVAFTIDDGYIDQAEVAGRVFAEFDCPVTTFVATGFLDGTLWFWWDKIEFVFSTTRRQGIRVQIQDRWLEYKWNSISERLAAQVDFIAQCKLVSDSDKHHAIGSLADAAEVLLPRNPPDMYAPMTWAQARVCEERGMTFGPHTVTHPILSRTSAEQAKEEIGRSWKRVQEEMKEPVPIFCYPNGGWADFGHRETTILRDEGLIGAVVGEPGFADPALYAGEVAGPYKVRRFGFPETVPRLVQYVSGVERLKSFVRREHEGH